MKDATTTLTRAEPKVYVKVAESGARRAQAFCPNCGSPLFTFDADKPTAIGLRVGLLDERAALAPTWQKWCNAAMPWLQNMAELEQAPSNARNVKPTP